MDTLPPELLLYLIPFFPLTSLIAARGVNTQWRYLAQTASLYPARKALLDVYLAAIIDPNFLSLMGALQPYVHEFDREAYITDLISRGCILPDLFELWVLEWPSTAVYFWAWPGLAEGCSINHEYSYIAGNSLSGSPIIKAIPMPKKEASSVGETCLGLGLWGADYGFGVAHLWLVVDANEKINDRWAGTLLWTDSDFDLNESTMRIFYNTPFEASNLIDFLSFESPSRKCSVVEWNLEGYYLEGVDGFDE